MFPIIYIFALSGSAMAQFGSVGQAGSSVFFHSEADCALPSQGHYINANFVDYSMVMELKRDTCWPDEVDTSTNNGAQRSSVWLAPRASWATDDPLDYCLWMYVRNECEGFADTMDITQSLDHPVCYPLGDGGYGAYWITQGKCVNPTVTGQAAKEAPAHDAY